MLEDLGKRPLSNPLATWEVIWLLVTPVREGESGWGDEQ